MTIVMTTVKEILCDIKNFSHKTSLHIQIISTAKIKSHQSRHESQDKNIHRTHIGPNENVSKNLWCPSVPGPPNRTQKEVENPPPLKTAEVPENKMLRLKRHDYDTLKFPLQFCVAPVLVAFPPSDSPFSFFFSAIV